MITLRPVTDADLPFLFRLYASTRDGELAPLPWSEEQKQAFLRMQFEAQRSHYARHYAGGRFDLVMADGAPVGRLYVHRGDREIHLIDICFLPPYRGRGFGTRLLSELLAEGAAQGSSVSLQVEKSNPAKQLYRRLGFIMAGDAGLYDHMTWQAPAHGAGASARQ
ncbi:MAG TPA: N-acetyltransferase [Nevskia sp.]|nr:N-acetyltransferase [Nevskia sp.]